MQSQEQFLTHFLGKLVLKLIISFSSGQGKLSCQRGIVLRPAQDMFSCRPTQQMKIAPQLAILYRECTDHVLDTQQLPGGSSISGISLPSFSLLTIRFITCPFSITSQPTVLREHKAASSHPRLSSWNTLPKELVFPKTLGLHTNSPAQAG